jgi:hypothetical protein
MRGGAQEPLTRTDIEDKFALCCRHGGWGSDGIEAACGLARRLFDGRLDLVKLRG